MANAQRYGSANPSREALSRSLLKRMHRCGALQVFSPVHHSVRGARDETRVPTATSYAQAPVLRGYAETMYRAKSWSKPRRACARIEATSLGLDIRYVVTSFAAGSASTYTTPSIVHAARPRT